MKKIISLIAVSFGLLLLVAIAAPFLIDVDKYRPKLVSEVNQMLGNQGKLELGRLGLKLWGRIQINVDGLKLSDAKGKPIITVQDAQFHLPILGLLSGSPEVRLSLRAPSIDLVQELDGKLNLLKITQSLSSSKKSEASVTQAASSTTAVQAGNNKKAAEVAVPALFLKSRFTFLLDKARLSFLDEKTKDQYKVNDLDLRLKDVSPTSEIPFEAAARLDLMTKSGLKILGPATISGKIFAKIDQYKFNSSLDLSQALIEYSDSFKKEKSIKALAEIEMSSNLSGTDISKFLAQLDQIQFTGSGKLTSDSVLQFKGKSNGIDLSKVAALSPMLAAYRPNGQLELAVQANGPTAKLNYGASVKLSKIVLENDALKQPLELSGLLEISTNQIEKLLLKFNAKDFNAQLEGSVQNFSAPHFKFSLASTQMDLDGLLKSSEKAEQKRKDIAKNNSSRDPSPDIQTSNSSSVVDYNSMFSPMRENPVLANASGEFDFHLSKLKTTGVYISTLNGKFALDRLIFSLKNLEMKIFDGLISGHATLNARSAKPDTSVVFSLNGIQTQKMVESQMPLAKNTIKGVLSSTMNIGGVGLNQPDLISNWKGSGKLEIRSAQLSTLDVGRQVQDGVIAKLPEFLKGKIQLPSSVLSQKGEYESLNMSYSLNNGLLSLTSFDGKAYQNKGLDLKGTGNVKLNNYGLDFALDIIDTYNLTHGSDHVVDNRYGKFVVSTKLGCTLFSPCFDFATTLGKLAQGAVQKRGKEIIQKAVGEKAANMLKGLFGR